MSECDWCGDREASQLYTMPENAGGWRAGTNIHVCHYYYVHLREAMR